MQKQIFSVRIISSLMLLLGLISCSKNNSMPQGTASLTIVNAVVGSISLMPNFSGNYPLAGYYINADYINYNLYGSLASGYSGFQNNSYSGTQKLALYNYPDTLPTSKPLFNLTLNLPIGSINTLFLTGTVALPDTLFTVDHPPYHPLLDSSTGIRFVNLSPGSAPININIQGQANGSEVNSLSYKGITNFKNYAATSNIGSYIFEFRDAASGALLATYLADGINNNGSDPNNPLNNWRFKNCTLALLGLPNGTDASAQTVLLVNNY